MLRLRHSQTKFGGCSILEPSASVRKNIQFPEPDASARRIEKQIFEADDSLQPSDIMQEPRDQGGPACLVACSNALPGIPVEVFIEENEVAPVGVFGEAGFVPMAGTGALFIGKEDSSQPSGDLIGYLLKIHQMARARRELDLEGIAVEVMIALEGFDQQVIHWEPNWPPPV